MAYRDGGTYLTAYSKEGDLVPISNVERGSKKLFTCPQCDGRLTPRKGEVKAHHFAHKPEANCNYESYLHKISKLLFEKRYNECLETKEPFYIEYEQERRCITCSEINQLPNFCDLNSTYEVLDLTKFFDRVSSEKGINGFVADILLHSSKREDVILIEFAVSHKCEQDKIDSGLRIVEFSIQEERQLNFITENKISNRKSICEFHNINPKRIAGNINSLENCNLKFKTFLISPEGKASLKKLSPNEVSLINNKGYKRISNLDLLDNQDDYLPDLILRAYDENPNFKNCQVCRYFSNNYEFLRNHEFWCNKLKEEIPDSNYGVGCDSFSEIPKKQRFMKLRTIKQAEYAELLTYESERPTISSSDREEEKYRFRKIKEHEYKFDDIGANIDCPMNKVKVPHTFCKSCAFSTESSGDNSIACTFERPAVNE